MVELLYFSLCFILPNIVWQLFNKDKLKGQRYAARHIVWTCIFWGCCVNTLCVTGVGTVWDIISYKEVIGGINIIPFSSSGSIPVVFDNVFNILMFVPFGFLLPLIWERFRRFWKVFLFGLGFSALIEIFQLFNYRTSDVDDLLMNTTGACVGYFIWALFAKIFRNSGKKSIEFTKSEPIVYIVLGIVGIFLLFNCRGLNTIIYKNDIPSIEISESDTNDNETKEYTMNRGVNLSALESKLKPSSFLDDEKTYTDIVSKGFDHIRLPVDFRNYCDADGVIEESFYKRLDDILKKASDAGLTVMLDFHGWYDINVGEGDDKLFLNIWKNLAEHYKDCSEWLLFELINEPHTNEGGDLDMSKLMELQTEAISQIREIDPERTIVIAAPEWNGPWTLKDLKVPDYDNLIVAVHTYEPLDFTHQGQAWAGKADVKIELTGQILNGVTEQLALISEFKERTGCKVVLNEFGLTTTGHISDKNVRSYIKCIVEYTKKHDIPWTYWSYSGDFGVYNIGFFGYGGSWRQNVVDALMS